MYWGNFKCCVEEHKNSIPLIHSLCYPTRNVTLIYHMHTSGTYVCIFVYTFPCISLLCITAGFAWGQGFLGFRPWPCHSLMTGFQRLLWLYNPRIKLIFPEWRRKEEIWKHRRQKMPLSTSLRLAQLSSAHNLQGFSESQIAHNGLSH